MGWGEFLRFQAISCKIISDRHEVGEKKERERKRKNEIRLPGVPISADVQQNALPPDCLRAISKTLHLTVCAERSRESPTFDILRYVQIFWRYNSPLFFFTRDYNTFSTAFERFFEFSRSIANILPQLF